MIKYFNTHDEFFVIILMIISKFYSSNVRYIIQYIYFD